MNIKYGVAKFHLIVCIFLFFYLDLMKAVSQENSSSAGGEVKTAELVILLDGLRVDPSVLSQSHEVLGESANTGSPLNEGVRAKLRLRSNPETIRSMARSQTLRVSFSLKWFLIKYLSLVHAHFTVN